MASFNRYDRQINHIRNMSQLLERLGIGPDKFAEHLGNTGVASAVQACETCPAVAVCQDWLLRATAELQQAPAFCSNASRFTRLKSELNPSGWLPNGNPSGRPH